MKVVCCKNCGAKYQLDDDDDISTFECSSCAGDLEFIENYEDDKKSSHSSLIDTFRHDNSYIVQCEDCGLKYKIKNNDNILDYECDSCGGSLRYLDDELNKELDRYIEERRQINLESQQNPRDIEIPYEEQETEDNTHSLKSLTNRLENFFSEDRMLEIADEEKREREIEEKRNSKTARTSIPDAVQTKFGREFAIPKTNDYGILKSFLKDEFFKGISETCQQPETTSNNSFGNIIDKISIKEPETNITSKEESLEDIIKENESDFDANMKPNTIVLGVGAIIFILSILEILTFNSGIGIIALFIGAIIFCYGIYKTKDVQEQDERTRIIREHLLTLPEEYYVFYNVKTPTAPSGINHLVVGPTGIYAIISKKFNPLNRLEAENKLINSTKLDENKIEEVPSIGSSRKFRYTTKQAKFSKDNEIKQKALNLGEDLINFLNENYIRNCFVEPLVGFINNNVVVINMPLTDEDLFIEELLNKIRTGTVKLDSETIDKCAVLLNKYSADCSSEI